MIKSFYLLLPLLIVLTASAQPDSPPVKHLAAQITAGITSDSLKVRAIYEWITANISYDTDLFKERHITTEEEYAMTQKPEKVLQRKKAVCMGYTNLFYDLCTAVDIRVFTINGYCKNFDLRTKRLVFSPEYHSWNAVKINNRWYLTDPTWSAGSIDVSTGLYNKKKNEEFYLRDGKAFIRMHIPVDPLWQLLDTPVSMQEFRYGLKPADTRKFNYADTLKVFETLSPEEQKLNTDFRSLRFDSGNEQAKLDIGYYYAKKAEGYSKEWEKLVTSFISKSTGDSYRRAKEEKSRVYSLLAETEKVVNLARYYYSLISPTSQSSRIALNNMRIADTYLHNIEMNKANLANYYEALKKVKY